MHDDTDSPASSDGAPSTRSTWRHGRLLPTNRLEAFSDGVFAIAITLLVLELRVPTAGEGLLGELAKEWPTYVGYFISFAFIGGAWMAHSNMTRFIQAADAALLRLNLLLLLFVSLLPFTTSLMATHHRDPGTRTSVFLFGLSLTLAAAMVSLLIRHAARTPGIADDDVAEEELRDFARERLVALIAYATTTVVGLIAPRVALIAFLVVSVAILLEPLARSPRQRRSEHKAG